jgi:hypothetical protein
MGFHARCPLCQRSANRSTAESAFAVDRFASRADHQSMAEYAIVTAVVASLAIALSSIPQSQLAAQLPVTAAKASALVARSARSTNVPVAQARAAYARAPFARPPLRYLYAAGWIGGRLRPVDCAFARVTPASTQSEFGSSIRRDARLVARLRRMKVTIGQAADALTRGKASVC